MPAAPLLFLAFLVSTTAALVIWESRRLRHQEQDVTAKLRAHGLTLEGALQKTFNRRGAFEIRSSARDSVPASTLRNDATVKLPGASGKSRDACIVQLDVPLPDLLICKVSEIDLLLGPLPSLRRTRTGDPAFDDAYAIFIQGEVEGPSGFRESGSATSRLWSDSLVRAELLDLRTVWVRVREGHLEIALEPTALHGAVRALRLAVGIHRAVRGHRGAEPPFAGLEIPPMITPRVREAVYLSWTVSFHLCLFTSWLVARTSVLREMHQEAWAIG
jgi:hypothetical protein